MSINDGGPAFPFGQVSELTGQPINGYHNDGMSLRDWFAGMALQGLVEACPAMPNELFARQSYGLADAMLAQRNAKPSP